MIQVQGIIAIFALVFKITQSNIHFRKGGGIPERNKTWVSMCCPQGGEAITRGIMSSRNLRQTIIRRRKHEPEPRQVILRRRKCKRKPRHIILRGRKRKRNLRHIILRRRKCKRKPRRFIIRCRKCEPKPGHVIIRGWMRQTESRAGRHPGVDGTTDFRASLYGGEWE